MSSSREKEEHSSNHKRDKDGRHSSATSEREHKRYKSDSRERDDVGREREHSSRSHRDRDRHSSHRDRHRRSRSRERDYDDHHSRQSSSRKRSRSPDRHRENNNNNSRHDPPPRKDSQRNQQNEKVEEEVEITPEIKKKAASTVKLPTAISSSSIKDDSNTTPKNTTTEENNNNNNAATTNNDEKTATATKLPVDVSAMMAKLAAQKQALQQQLQQQKKELTQNDMLKRVVQQQKIHKQAQEIKKDGNTPAIDPSTKEVVETAKRMAALDEKLRAQLAKVPKLSGSMLQLKKPGDSTDSSKFIPPPLLLDEKGREVDEHGNVIAFRSSLPTVNNVATLKANQRTSRPNLALIDAATSLPTAQTMGDHAQKKKILHFDPNLRAPAADRPKRSFNLMEAGSLIKKAEKIRAKIKEEDSGANNNNIKKENQNDANNSAALEAPKTPFEAWKNSRKSNQRVDIPDVEWWDKFLLKGDDYADPDSDQIRIEEVTHYVEHPVPVKPPGEPDGEVALSMFLTKKEQKKLRKQKRAAMFAEKQERILMGLEEAPAPKVKISNLMRVLGSEATANPTEIEQEVRKQMAERVAAHDARNQARKLTKEERKEKRKKKLTTDAKNSTHVVVFRIRDLSNPQHRFKIDANARENYLTGCTILKPGMNMVLVEGGAKAIRKFKKLMLQRIDWQLKRKNPSDESSKEEEGEENNGENNKNNSNGNGKSDASDNNNGAAVPEGENKCELVWEGAVLKGNFEGFKFETPQNENYLRHYLNQHWSEHYWDMCKNFRPDEVV